MLLVDHDQAEVRHRREDRRARAHHDARLAVADAPPLVVALPGRELAVQHRDRRAEAAPGRAHQHRREADLRHEQDRAAAASERRLDGPEEDLRLAAAGHAAQQERAEAACRNRGQQLVERPRLVVGRRERGGLAQRQAVRRAHLALGHEPQHAELLQPADRPAQRRLVRDQLGDARAPARGAQPCHGFGLRLAARRRLARRLQHGDLDLPKAGGVERLLDRDRPLAPQARQPWERIAAEALLERRHAQRSGLKVLQQRVVGSAGLQQAHDRPARTNACGRQHEPVALAGRREVVVGDEGGQVEKRRRRERGFVEHLRDFLELLPKLAALRVVAAADDDADRAPAAERHQHAHAPLRRRRALRHPIAEGRLEGQRHRDRHDALVHVAHSIRRGGGRGSARRATPTRRAPGGRAA